MKFMPRHMRASHVLYSVSEDRNMCLYNSMSVALYGHEKRASFLKLGAIMTGIQQRNRMIEEVI